MLPKATARQGTVGPLNLELRGRGFYHLVEEMDDTILQVNPQMNVESVVAELALSKLLTCKTCEAVKHPKQKT